MPRRKIPAPIRGAWRFLKFAMANAIKRVAIAFFGIFVGFIGPILAIKDVHALLQSHEHFWNAFAEVANHENGFADVILACMPAGFLCLTDLAAHVFDDDFKYSRNRISYLGLFGLAASALFLGGLLIASYVTIKSPPPPEGRWWIASFEYAWPVAKLILKFTVAFELLLAWLESLHEAEDRQWQI